MRKEDWEPRHHASIRGPVGVLSSSSGEASQPAWSRPSGCLEFPKSTSACGGICAIRSEVPSLGRKGWGRVRNEIKIQENEETGFVVSGRVAAGQAVLVLSEWVG